jgi:hypothetical protein
MRWPDPPARARYHNHYLEIDGWKHWTMGSAGPPRHLADPERDDGGAG